MLSRRSAGAKKISQPGQAVQKKSPAPVNNLRSFGLARDDRADCVRESGLLPTLPRGTFMILVAIFSVIVLLMCWLCYSGDCNS